MILHTLTDCLVVDVNLAYNRYLPHGVQYLIKVSEICWCDDHLIHEVGKMNKEGLSVTCIARRFETTT